MTPAIILTCAGVLAILACAFMPSAAWTRPAPEYSGPLPCEGSRWVGRESSDAAAAPVWRVEQVDENWIMLAWRDSLLTMRVAEFRECMKPA